MLIMKVSMTSFLTHTVAQPTKWDYFAHDSMLNKKFLTPQIDFGRFFYSCPLATSQTWDFHFLLLFSAMTLPVSLLKSFKKLQLSKNINK